MTTRSEALAHLESFLDRVPRYESTRNYDREGHKGVSQLSRWIRYRVITEEECVRAVLSRHTFAAAQKFIQEIVWRTYWKGWLELHPSVWSSYRDELSRLEATYQTDGAYHAACEGRTSLGFFNDWVRELLDTGYLHNHTRMWFASTWIFTLKLPWLLGAAFMYHNLLDGDPASNTLSWRWVAGLHTPGKNYAARPENIATYSEHRWTPKMEDLVPDPKPLPPDGPHPVSPLMEVAAAPPREGSLVLLHDDDLSADLSDEFSSCEPRYALLDVSRETQSARVASHVQALRKDTETRTGAQVVRTAEDLSAFATRVGIATIHSMVPPLGFEYSTLMRLAQELEHKGVSIAWHRRAWDARYLPLAHSGFFPFWQKIQQTWA
jgi:deoxyribodipyrimidine photo-lyase